MVDAKCEVHKTAVALWEHIFKRLQSGNLELGAEGEGMGSVTQVKAKGQEVAWGEVRGVRHGLLVTLSKGQCDNPLEDNKSEESRSEN